MKVIDTGCSWLRNGAWGFFFFFSPTEDACVCDGVRVCVYFISAPAAGEITSTLYSVTAIR